MRYVYALGLALLTFLVPCHTGEILCERQGPPATERDRVVEHVQAVSVTVLTSTSAGSGTLITCTNQAGEPVTYCLTAGHVVETEKPADPSEHRAASIVNPLPLPWPLSAPESNTVAAVKVMVTITAGDLIVGKTLIDADVIRFSAAEVDDIAILRLRKSLNHPAPTFWLAPRAPKIGAPLVHVGSMMGPFGAGSFTTGVLSRTGRVMFGVEFDQTTCTALPGSSGGGVFTDDGVYVGMLVRGAAATVNFIVPARRLIAWASREGVAFLFDPSAPAPAVLP